MGQNGDVKWTIALLHMLLSVVDQTFEKVAWLSGRKSQT
jgi:hypothetical protein